MEIREEGREMTEPLTPKRCESCRNEFKCEDDRHFDPSNGQFRPRYLCSTCYLKKYISHDPMAERLKL